MYEQAIDEKLKKVAEVLPKEPELKKWLNNSDLWLCIYTALSLDGVNLNKRKLVDMLEGKIMEDMPIELYGFVHRFNDVYKDMESCIIMDQSLDEKILARWYSMLFDKDTFRMENPIIYRWGYIPPHFRAVREELEGLFRTSCDKGGSDFYKYAFRYFLRFLGIYPYGDDSVKMACVVLLYQLRKAGLPMPEFSVDDEDFDAILTRYFDGKGEEEFQEMAERAVLNRVEQLSTLCIAAGE